MNNFNNVFLAIKKHCDGNGEIKTSDCFAEIAKDAGVPKDKIEFFLDTLQDLHLITYSMGECYVRLTSFGKKQERLFPTNS